MCTTSKWHSRGGGGGVPGDRAKRVKSLEWRLTLNHYRAAATPTRIEETLFPFHTDIASNGDVTAILTLLSGAHIDFRPAAPDAASEDPSAHRETTRVALEPGSLLLASGAARWSYVHRVIRGGPEERLSLVLGCR
eukprot:Hpha_TRINITY_DN12942_c0_g1::TRINITY_DN12942_c0_g1_i1::g.164754::m.164754